MTSPARLRKARSNWSWCGCSRHPSLRPRRSASSIGCCTRLWQRAAKIQRAASPPLILCNCRLPDSWHLASSAATSQKLYFVAKVPWEFRRYWPRKSVGLPRITATPAVSRQCWPNALSVFRFQQSAVSVLANRGLKGDAAIDVNGVARTRQHRSGNAVFRIEIRQLITLVSCPCRRHSLQQRTTRRPAALPEERRERRCRPDCPGIVYKPPPL